MQYWARSADPDRNIPTPTYVVICAFKKLEAWQPGSFPDQPRLELDLIELPDRYEALLFLAGREPVGQPSERAEERKGNECTSSLFVIREPSVLWSV